MCTYMYQYVIRCAFIHKLIACTHTYTYMYTYMCTYTYIYTYVYIYMSMHINITCLEGGKVDDFCLFI